MSMYTGIPQEKLKWLDGFTGKTLRALTNVAVVATSTFIQPALSARIVEGSTYVVTLTDGTSTEVIAIKSRGSVYDLVRGLDGTTPKAWPIDTVIYQSFTANQLSYLMRKAENIPLAPNDFAGNYIGTLTQVDPADSVEKQYWIFSAANLPALPQLQYKASSTATEAYDTVSGAANTEAIKSAGIAAHPAAEFCVNYREGGYSDWYLPSSGELAALLPVKETIATRYGKNILSSTCPREGGGNPSWAGQVMYLNWVNSVIKTDGSKTLPIYLVVPFRRVLKPA